MVNKQYIISFIATMQGNKLVMTNFKQMQMQIGKTGGAIATTGKKMKGMGTSMMGMAKRALMVIPVWLALRAAFMAFITTIKDGIQHIVLLDKAMARSRAVTHGVGNLGKFMTELRGAARGAAIRTGTTTPQALEAFYRFGTAGIQGKLGISAMNSALKTSVAIMGDSTQTARAMADIYNLLGDTIEGARTESEKFAIIGATLSILYEDNAFELNELMKGMQQFVGIAKSYNLSLNETVTLLATLHTGGQRAGQSGTQMSRAFMRMTAHMDRVQEVLGEPIDRKNLDYFDLFVRLMEKISKDAKELGKLPGPAVMGIFGIKGAKGTGVLAAMMDKWVANMTKVNEMSVEDKLKAWNVLFEIQMNTLDRQGKIFKELRNHMVEAFLTGGDNAGFFTQKIKDLNESMKAMIPGAILFNSAMESMDNIQKKRQTGMGLAFGAFPQVAAAAVGGKIATGIGVDLAKMMFGQGETKEGENFIDRFQRKWKEMYGDIKDDYDIVSGKQKIKNILLAEELDIVEAINALNTQSTQTLAGILQKEDWMVLAGFTKLEIERQKLAILIQQDAETKKQYQQSLKLQKISLLTLQQEQQKFATLAMQHKQAPDIEKPRIRRFMEILSRDYKPEELANIYSAGGLDASVLEQYRQHLKKEAQVAIGQAYGQLAGLPSAQLPRGFISPSGLPQQVRNAMGLLPEFDRGQATGGLDFSILGQTFKDSLQDTNNAIIRMNEKLSKLEEQTNEDIKKSVVKLDQIKTILDDRL